MASIKDLARISDAIYGKVDASGGWQVSYIDDGIFNMGFKAGVYAKGNEKVIAFCGSDDIWDWLNNISFLEEKAPFQAKQAIKYYIDIMKKGHKVILTGHSLGGALAEIVGNIFETKVVTFNSPGTLGLTINYNTWTGIEKTVAMTRNPNALRDINNFLIDGDIVSRTGPHVGVRHWAAAELTGGEEIDDLIVKMHSINQWLSDKRYDGNGNYLIPKSEYDYGYDVVMA